MFVRQRPRVIVVYDLRFALDELFVHLILSLLDGKKVVILVVKRDILTKYISDNLSNGERVIFVIYAYKTHSFSITRSLYN